MHYVLDRKKMIVCTLGVRGLRPGRCILVAFHYIWSPQKNPPPPLWGFGLARTIIQAVYRSVRSRRAESSLQYDTIRSAHVAPSCPVWFYRCGKRCANALGPTRCVARTIRPQPGILQLLPAAARNQYRQ